MAKKSNYKSQIRDSGEFIALPHSVVDSAAFRGLSVHARALLLDIARQFNGHNNGSLLCSRDHMVPLGWTSSDMLTKSKRELLAAKLIHEMARGGFPNRASWYAVTWQGLDRLKGFDAGTAETFIRGAYKDAELPPPKPSREQLYDRWRAPPVPPHGTEKPAPGAAF